MKALNLATQPFRNERLPRLLLGGAAVLVALVTVWHGFLLARVLPGRTSALHAEVAALAQRAATLRREVASLQTARPPAAEVAHWAALKELVDQRAFSWTELFSVLEDVLPDGIRLVSISPKLAQGEVTLEVEAVARTYEEGIDFIRVLEDRPEFKDVLPVSRGNAGTDFRYTMTYRPSATPRTPRPAEPTPTVGGDEPGDEPGDEGEGEVPAEDEEADEEPEEPSEVSG